MLQSWSWLEILVVCRQGDEDQRVNVVGVEQDDRKPEAMQNLTLDGLEFGVDQEDCSNFVIRDDPKEST